MRQTSLHQTRYETVCGNFELLMKLNKAFKIYYGSENVQYFECKKNIPKTLHYCLLLFALSAVVLYETFDTLTLSKLLVFAEKRNKNKQDA